MRVISQNRKNDFPYENGTVFFCEAAGRNIIKIKISGNDALGVLGEYSTREKALKAMEMLRERYSNSDLCKDDIQFRAETMVGDANSAIKKFMIDITYFQFPKDDEVE